MAAYIVAFLKIKEPGPFIQGFPGLYLVPPSMIGPRTTYPTVFRAKKPATILHSAGLFSSR